MHRMHYTAGYFEAAHVCLLIDQRLMWNIHVVSALEQQEEKHVLH